MLLNFLPMLFGIVTLVSCANLHSRDKDPEEKNNISPADNPDLKNSGAGNDSSNQREQPSETGTQIDEKTNYPADPLGLPDIAFTSIKTIEGDKLENPCGTLGEMRVKSNGQGYICTVTRDDQINWDYLLQVDKDSEVTWVGYFLYLDPVSNRRDIAVITINKTQPGHSKIADIDQYCWTSRGWYSGDAGWASEKGYESGGQIEESMSLCQKPMFRGNLKLKGDPITSPFLEFQPPDGKNVRIPMIRFPR